MSQLACRYGECSYCLKRVFSMSLTEVEVADSANALAQLLEAAAKGLKHRRHRKHILPARAAVKAVMARYFERQRSAILRDLKPHIDHALRLHPREAANPGKPFAQSLLPRALSPLTFAATSSELSDYNEAITSAIEGAAAVIAKELKTGAQSVKDFAADYLRDNSLSKLTGDIADTTVERLQNALADAWEAGGSYDQVVAAINDTFDDFSETRAGLIAQTEVNDAYNSARDGTARDIGATEKAWETESGDPCPTCVDNEDAGWIGIDEDFPSGDDAPTAHPNCECVTNYRFGDDEE